MPRTTITTARPGAAYTPTVPVVLPAEAAFVADLARGARGSRARLVQEWLCLHDVHVAVDGGFGAATATGVRDFRAKAGLPPGEIVDRATFDALVAPMRAALAPIRPARGATLGQLVVAYARQHLAQHPREVGGQNMGPWVRLYMDGNQGAAWPWCAGFATLVLRQAAHTLGVPMPVTRTYSCDVLAGNATANQCFVGGGPTPRDVTPGSFFLVRRTRNDWEHVGIVTAVEGDVLRTIEGNTNDDGDREGYEVCARVRGFDRKDFVLIA